MEVTNNKEFVVRMEEGDNFNSNKKEKKKLRMRKIEKKNYVLGDKVPKDNSKNLRVLMKEFEVALGSVSIEDRKLALQNMIEKTLPFSDEKFDLTEKILVATRRNPLDHFPLEILVRIFFFLSKKDLARSAQVCWGWNELTKNKCLLDMKEDGFVYCGVCHTMIAKEKDIVCRKYRLDYALAYNFKSVVNVAFGEKDIVDLSAAKVAFRRMSCKTCKTEIGVKCKFLGNKGEEHERIGELCENECGAPLMKKKYLIKRSLMLFPSEPTIDVILVCGKCKITIGKEKDRIGWNYRLNGAQAYQFSKLENIHLSTFQDADYATGQYLIANTLCVGCNTVLGIKYIDAPDSRNAYKIGTYLIEKPKLKIGEFYPPKIATEKKEKTTSPSVERRVEKKSSFFGLLYSFVKPK